MLDIAHKWKGFGGALRIAPPLLDEIENEPGANVHNSLKKVLSLFLKQNYDFIKHGYPTWRKIIEAIFHRAGGSNPALAMKIAKNHLKVTGKCSYAIVLIALLLSFIKALTTVQLICCECCIINCIMCKSRWLKLLYLLQLVKENMFSYLILFHAIQLYLCSLHTLIL